MFYMDSENWVLPAFVGMSMVQHSLLVNAITTLYVCGIHQTTTREDKAVLVLIKLSTTLLL